MPESLLNESDLESAVIGWFRELGYQLAFGPELAPGAPLR